jgi:hypothetical protein
MKNIQRCCFQTFKDLWWSYPAATPCQNNVSLRERKGKDLYVISQILFRCFSVFTTPPKQCFRLIVNDLKNNDRPFSKAERKDTNPTLPHQTFSKVFS